LQEGNLRLLIGRGLLGAVAKLMQEVVVVQAGGAGGMP
jgi:hypothetical protein